MSNPTAPTSTARPPQPASGRDISLTQLRYFVRAAETESMSRAAESLFIAQSAVSTSVANLERALGAELFVRHRAKGLSLTRDGAVFLERARTILADLEEAANIVSPRHLTGDYAVGCFPTLVPFWMPGACDGLAERFPELTVRVREIRHDEIAPALLARELEAVFTYDFPSVPGVEFTHLADARLYAIVGDDSPLAERGRATLAELAATHPLVLLDMPGSTDYFTRTLLDRGVEPRIAYRFGSYEAVRAMVARGHGFSLLNQEPRTDRTYDGLRVRRVEIADELEPLRIGLAHLAGRALSRKGMAFLEECERLLAGG